MAQLEKAGTHLQKQLQEAYGSAATVVVRYEGARTLESQARAGKFATGAGSKALYILAGGGPGSFQTKFSAHGGRLTLPTAFQLANPAATEGHAIGVSRGDIGVVNAAKLANDTHAANIVLHEGVHLGGYRPADHSVGQGLMVPSISPTDPLLPLVDPVPEVLRWNLR